MVSVTVAIGKFFVMLLEALLWAAVAGGGILVLGLLVAGSIYLLARRTLFARRARK